MFSCAYESNAESMPDRIAHFTPGTDVFSGIGFAPKTEHQAAASPDSQTGRLYNNLSLVEKGLSDQSLFPRVDIRSAMALGTFARVKASKQVADLVRIFADAELETSVGFNVGTCEISLTVPLPEGGGDVTTSNQAVLWGMLGVLPHQEELEAMSAAWGSEASSQLLSNRCLEAFGQGTGAGVNVAKLCWRTRTIRLVLGVFRDLQRGICKKGLFKYSPSYITLSGLQLSSHEDIEEVLAAEKKSLVAKMVEDTWTKLEEYPYIVGDEIRATLQARLLDYFDSGIKDQRDGFEPSPSHPLSFFLHGPAGAGKSTFVLALAAALQSVIRAFLHAERRCHIVKVPLNSMTADSLNSILCVQGISDWSIERVVEQSLCKGHSIILHFEEVPRDQDVQDTLFAAVKQMLAGLLRRYPHLGGNVVYLFTSNYEPGAGMLAHAVPVTVTPPAMERQAGHVGKMLRELVRKSASLPAQDVKVEIKAPLPCVDDMRRLCAWWLSVGFHVTEQLDRMRAKAKANAAANGKREGEDGSSCALCSVHCTVAGSSERELELIVAIERRATEHDMICSWAGGHALLADPYARPQPGQVREEARIRVVASTADLLYVREKRMATGLCCMMRIVPCLGGCGQCERRRGAAVGDEARGWEALTEARTVVAMCEAGVLTPGVVVLHGADAKRKEMEAALMRMCRKHRAPKRQEEQEEEQDSRSVRVALREEGDQIKVNGHETEIRGGLLKFIDDYNNPNMARPAPAASTSSSELSTSTSTSGSEAGVSAGEEGLCVVVCEVNEAGQFMLRELLEGGATKTHRYAINKAQVLFIISVDEGAGIEDMTKSRAHAIIACR